ncbi:MAG: hypothetical protein ACFFEN_04085 [Candidatus Thorarchaeota archaeon]
MDSNIKITELFEKIMAMTPEMFRTSIKPMWREAAEQTARLRISGYGSRNDLFSSLFEIIPSAFQQKNSKQIKGGQNDRYFI